MRRRFMMRQVYFSIDNYLTIEALVDNLTVKFPRTIEYCIDGQEWNILPQNTDTPPINASQTISFRANLIPSSITGIGTFKISRKCNLKGNCMSMLFGDNAADKFSLKGKDYAFCQLFFNCPIINVSSNFLPATTLAYGCYDSMFYGCSSLTTPPELLATTLADGCYSYMFYRCSSLTTAPELPATTLAVSCYGSMFYNCTNLNYIKMLATDISATNCLHNWVRGVSSTGTFVKNPDMTNLPTGTSGIPSGWTVVNDGEESGGDNLNTFVIDIYYTHTLIAEEGMTWEEWVDSEYNEYGFTINNGMVYYPERYSIDTFYIGYSNYNIVSATDTISPTEHYSSLSDGGAGD